MQTAIGHNGLYKLGFDGAAIAQLRKLDVRQYRELLTILSELHADKYVELSAEAAVAADKSVGEKMRVKGQEGDAQ